ncbi:MAG TPA: cupin domain-containing protein [Dehalococcoidia bacterium]|jgi:quercetin dioxygenase-like cupin family protein
MAAHVTRSDGRLDERAVLAAVEAERLSPHRWLNAPGDVYAAHRHAYHKVLFCLRGSITFHLVGEGDDIELLPGDRLDIEPRTPHAATVGPRGVECIEAARA